MTKPVPVGVAASAATRSAAAGDIPALAGVGTLRRWDAEPRGSAVDALIKAMTILPFDLPPRVVMHEDVALYPGGAVAVRDPLRGILVCDPLESLCFAGDAAIRLRLAVADQSGVATLSHEAAGIVLRQGLPRNLPPQAVSVIADARGLPLSAGRFGPVLVQWLAGGATLWPLVEAPALLALAATIAAVPVDPAGLPLDANDWYPPASADLLSPAIADYIGDLLAPEVSDAVRFALVDVCVDGEGALAEQMAASLAVLPAAFRFSPSLYPGDPPPDWAGCGPRLRRDCDPLVFLAIQPVGGARRAIQALRRAAGGLRAILVDAALTECPLDSDAAAFMALQAGPQGRLGMLLAPPAEPAELCGLAATLAEETGGTAFAASPCWGFCQRIGPDGQQAGNAGWFGMGAGLDELDDIMLAATGYA
jgi:hypothetical protein